MTPAQIRQLASAISDRLAELHQARYPATGQPSDESLAAMMAAESGIDVDTMKVVIRPASRLAPWSHYEVVLAALNADQETIDWFRDAHGELTAAVPAWRPPPRDIADITTPAEFMTALRRMQETPPAISVPALARKMRSNDSDNTWQREQLRKILKADTLPPARKPASVRNLITVLCENAHRPAADVDHFLSAWQRLQPATAPRPATFAAWRPPAARLPEEDVERSLATEPWRPAKTTLVMAGMILAFVILVLAIVV